MVCLCLRCASFHVVVYTQKTLALSSIADTLLNSSSYHSSWVLLSPAPAVGRARALLPWAPLPQV